jgi:hypothetical protein
LEASIVCTEHGRIARQHGTTSNGDPTIVLEAVVSEDMWIWPALFSLPRSLNDINILQRSPIFCKIINRVTPACRLATSRHQYTMGY